MAVVKRGSVVGSCVGLLLLVLSVCGAYAGIPDDIAAQQRSLNKGIRSGELNGQEAEVLRYNLERIRYRFDRVRADGVITSAERAKLDRMLDRNSRMIYKKKHNTPIFRIEENEWDND